MKRQKVKPSLSIEIGIADVNGTSECIELIRRRIGIPTDWSDFAGEGSLMVGTAQLLESVRFMRASPKYRQRLEASITESYISHRRSEREGD